MSEFKSGDIVKCGHVYYTYACVHPTEKGLSIVINPVDYSIGGCFYTDQLSLVPKTHKVNGFEVPAPMRDPDLDEVKDTDVIYFFSCSSSEGYIGITKCATPIVALKCGLVFKTASDIKKNIAALQDIDPSTVE